MEKKTGVQLDFDTGEAIRVLKELGLLSEKQGKHHVLMLDAARRVLPQAPQSVITRSVSGDIFFFFLLENLLLNHCLGILLTFLVQLQS